MHFTTYYSHLIKCCGIPQLTVDQLQSIMNIAVAESKIAEQELKGKHLTGDAKVMLGKHSYNCNNQLNNLTKGEEPGEVFKRIVGDYHEP